MDLGADPVLKKLALSANLEHFCKQQMELVKSVKKDAQLAPVLKFVQVMIAVSSLLMIMWSHADLDAKLVQHLKFVPNVSLDFS